MKKRSTVAMALAMGITMVGSAVAARPVMGRPVSTSKISARSIRPVKTSAEFNGRQTRKFVATKIVIPPMKFAGGQNLAAAKASVEKALNDVEKEVKDQKRLIGGNKNRIIAAKKNVRKYTDQRNVHKTELDAIQAELDVLQGLSNPSSAIQSCIDELKSDKAAATQQVNNDTKTINEYNARLKFYAKVAVEAKANHKRLNTAVTHLTNAKRSLSMVKRPKVKSGWKIPKSFYN